jgi:hypothetical protein
MAIMKTFKTIEQLRSELSYAEELGAIPNLNIYVDHLIIEFPYQAQSEKLKMVLKLKDYIKEKYLNIRNIEINYIDLDVNHIENMIVWHDYMKITR